MSQRSMEVKVGALIIVSLALLAGFVIVMGGMSLEPTYRVYVDFDNPGGLQSGAPVRISGVKVGRVTAIEFRGGQINLKTQEPEPPIRVVAQPNKVVNVALGDWQMGSIVTLQSGFPITPNIGGTDRSGTGGGFDRPNATGVSPYLDNPTTSNWFNLAAFTVPTPGTYGNVGRNSVVGPGVVAFDFSLHKDFKITETHRLEYRWELFNAANHPVWATPNTNANSAGSFGSITGTRLSMRQMQMALKYVF